MLLAAGGLERHEQAGNGWRWRRVDQLWMWKNGYRMKEEHPNIYNVGSEWFWFQSGFHVFGLPGLDGWNKQGESTTSYHGTRWPKLPWVLEDRCLKSGPRKAGGKNGVWTSPIFKTAATGPEWSARFRVFIECLLSGSIHGTSATALMIISRKKKGLVVPKKKQPMNAHAVT